jgi:hypothetical protein
VHPHRARRAQQLRRPEHGNPVLQECRHRRRLRQPGRAATASMPCCAAAPSPRAERGAGRHRLVGQIPCARSWSGREVEESRAWPLQHRRRCRPARWARPE